MHLSLESKMTRIALLMLCALGVFTAVALIVYPLLSLPAEDAIILHQYSRNLAETGSISYIPGGPHAEGATDFLWMLYIAAGLKLHIPTSVTTGLANLGSALGLALILLRLAKQKAAPIPLLAIVGIIGLFPQTQAALLGFSVLPFSFALALAVLFLEEGADSPAALSFLLLCLIRPDGIVFALPLLVRRLLRSGSLRTALPYLCYFVLPGIAYFFWRWHYFSSFLPLPFLVKSDTRRTFGLFAPNADAILRYLAFSLILAACCLGRRLAQARYLSLVLSLILIPSAFYSFVRLDQNVDMRFYAFLPISAALLVAIGWNEPAAPRRDVLILAATAAFAVLIGVTTIYTVSYSLRIPSLWERNRRLAEEMNTPELRGTMLTTEAGLFPYFSRWKPYDGWGLDTAQFATHLIQPADVVALSPDVILFHPSNLQLGCSPRIGQPHSQRSWGNMIANLQTAVASTRRYQTWKLPLYTRDANKGPFPLGTPTNDDLCWDISKTYRGRAALEDILARYGGSSENN